MYLQQLFNDCLREPAAAIAYEMSRRLAEMFPDRAVVEGWDWDFTLLDYAQAGLCSLRREETVHAQFTACWDEDEGVAEAAQNAWFEVEWRGHALDVALLSDGDGTVHFWILADDAPTARDFFRAVCEWTPEVRDEILVFDGGRWDDSGALFRAARPYSFENLILPGPLKAGLRADLARFFASRALYEAIGAPWKRGLLLTGPPGNGKTHAIKALVHELGQPCLYVKTFVSECRTEPTNIRRIFERARRSAPCLLVFEDLDALVTDENRSFFLNELDGFAANAGIATVATTNHPEKLDPAIVERPSRFDRTYHFGLPGPAERRAFLDRWAEAAAPASRPSAAALAGAAEATEGFSFASLKELVLSSLMALAAASPPAAMDDVLAGQVGSLRAQMAATAARKAEPAA